MPKMKISEICALGVSNVCIYVMQLCILSWGHATSVLKFILHVKRGFMIGNPWYELQFIRLYFYFSLHRLHYDEKVDDCQIHSQIVVLLCYMHFQ